MGFLAIVVGLGTLIALFWKRDRPPTAREDEAARTIGHAMQSMPMTEALGAVGAPEFVPSPLASDYEPDGDTVLRVEG